MIGGNCGFFDGLRRDKRNKEAAASSVKIVQEDPKENDSTPEEEQFEDAHVRRQRLDLT